jgi:hypothetical protein
MAFIVENGTVISFADYQDVFDRDQRLFDSNEGLTDDVIEPLLERATQRILDQIKSTAWWKTYWLRRSSDFTFNTSADIPNPDIDKIISRTEDFTDLCVYTALAEYILPAVADFGNQDNAERLKMGYYEMKSSKLFAELITAGDWYDFDGDGVIQSTEKDPGKINLRRVR